MPAGTQFCLVFSFMLKQFNLTTPSIESGTCIFLSVYLSKVETSELLFPSVLTPMATFLYLIKSYQLLGL